jgi:hypothetical protein
VIKSLRRRQPELTEQFHNVLIKIAGPDLETRVNSISSQLAKYTVQLFEQKADAPGSYKPIITKHPGNVPIVTRSELSNKSRGEVVICPSKVAGVEFLTKYNAWGFVNISKRRKPAYLAMYIGRPESSVLYFGEIDRITKPLQSKDELTQIQEKDKSTFVTGKRAVHLKQGTLMKLADPIPLKNNRMAPRGLRYTTLEKLIQSQYFEEL